MKLLRTAIAGLSIALFSCKAWAQTTDKSGIYVEGGYDFARMDLDQLHSEFYFHVFSVKLGYRLNDHVSVEGSVGTTFNAPGVNSEYLICSTVVTDSEYCYDEFVETELDEDRKAKLLGGLEVVSGAFARGHVPLNRNIDLYGKIGYSFANIDVNVGSRRITGATEGPAYGMGVEFSHDTGPNKADGLIWLELMNYALNDNVDLFSAGVSVGARF